MCSGHSKRTTGFKLAEADDGVVAPDAPAGGQIVVLCVALA